MSSKACSAKTCTVLTNSKAEAIRNTKVSLQIHHRASTIMYTQSAAPVQHISCMPADLVLNLFGILQQKNTMHNSFQSLVPEASLCFLYPCDTSLYRAWLAGPSQALLHVLLNLKLFPESRFAFSCFLAVLRRRWHPELPRLLWVALTSASSAQPSALPRAVAARNYRPS